MRRSILLSLPPQLVFPGTGINCDEYQVSFPCSSSTQPGKGKTEKVVLNISIYSTRNA